MASASSGDIFTPQDVIQEIVDALPVVLLQIVYSFANTYTAEPGSIQLYNFILFQVGSRSNALLQLNDDKTTSQKLKIILKNLLRANCYGTAQSRTLKNPSIDYWWSNDEFKKQLKLRLINQGPNYAAAIVKIASPPARGSKESEEPSWEREISDIFILRENIRISFHCSGMKIKRPSTPDRHSAVYAGTGEYALTS